MGSDTADFTDCDRVSRVEEGSSHMKLIIIGCEYSGTSTLAEFLKQYEPFMSDSDKVRILVNKAKQSGDWL